MPASGKHQGSGAAPYIDFNGTTLTPYRAFAWSTTLGVPVLANGTTTHVAGVTAWHGKGGFLAVPGALVEIEVAGSVTVGTLGDSDGSGRLTGSGSHFKCWETKSAGIVTAEFWKPKG